MQLCCLHGGCGEVSRIKVSKSHYCKNLESKIDFAEWKRSAWGQVNLKQRRLKEMYFEHFSSKLLRNKRQSM